MTKEYKSLEHIIRNIVEGIGTIGDDKPKGTPTTFMTRKYKSQNGGHVSAGKGNTANMKQADDIKLECSCPPDMSNVSAQTNSEDGKKKKQIKETPAPSYGDAASVASWPAAEDGKKKIKEDENIEENQVYHVSWGPGLDHEVVAKHGDEAISKAKDHLISKSPKLKDPKYSDTFSKKPTVHNISNERKLQKEENEDSVSKGTEERRKVVNVGRPDTAKNPMDTKAKLVKQAEIKTKIIDEAEKTDDPNQEVEADDKPKTKHIKDDDGKDKVALTKGKTQVDFKPVIKNAPAEDRVNEGIMDTLKKGAKVAGVAGALGAHAGKLYDVGNVMTQQDPAHAVTTALTYANPTSRALNMLPTAFKADKANKGEDEKARQKKFGTKLVTKEENMTDEVNNPLIDAFLALQNETGNVFEAAKHLSAKQKKIAAVAGDKEKIDAADFAALRAGKKVEEEVEQIDEIGDTKAGQNTLKSYTKQAGGASTKSAATYADTAARAAPGGNLAKEMSRKSANRAVGVNRAVDRLKEEEQIDETKKPEVSVYDGAAHVKDATGKVVASYSKKEHGSDYMKKANAHVVKEDVEFSAEELAHFDSVLEALGMSKDATQKGSFKKAGTNPNGDPVRPTVPDRDLTDDVEHVQETSSEKKADYVDKATSAIVNKDVVGRSANKHALRIQKIKRDDPFIDWKKTDSSVKEETEKKEYKKLSYDEFVKGRIENPTAEQHKEIGRRLKKAGVPGSGWHFKKAKEMQKNVKEETIEEGRKKKSDSDEPTYSGRDPKQHIQVIAGQAAAGRHIEFHHNDGSKSTITPQKGREIVAKLNGMKPAERHAAVNKMHDSSKGI